MSSKRTRRTQYRRYAPPAKPVESVEYPPMAGDLLRAASLRFGEFVTDAGEMFVFANRAVRRGRAALTHKRIRVDAGGDGHGQLVGVGGVGGAAGGQAGHRGDAPD